MPKKIPAAELLGQIDKMGLPRDQKEALKNFVRGMAVDPRNRGMIPENVFKAGIKQLKFGRDAAGDILPTSRIEELEQKTRETVKPQPPKNPPPGIRKIGGR